MKFYFLIIFNIKVVCDIGLIYTVYVLCTDEKRRYLMYRNQPEVLNWVYKIKNGLSSFNMTLSPEERGKAGNLLKESDLNKWLIDELAEKEERERLRIGQ
jgi:hypothetical protein